MKCCKYNNAKKIVLWNNKRKNNNTKYYEIDYPDTK